MDAHHHKSYQGILKSAALLGSARVMTLVIGLGRVKAIALMIGPVGVGLIGTYDVMVSMAIYLFGLGIHSSGVRQVAVARTRDDPARTARTVMTLRRLAWTLGLLGTLIVAPLAWTISRLTFGDARQGMDILILSPVVVINSIFFGSVATLQGFQRIGDLARLTVVSAVGQAVALVILVYFFGERGIACGFVAGAVFSMFMSRRILGKAPDLPHAMPWADSMKEGGEFVKLGLGLTNALLLSTFVAYATRTLIARDLGLEAVGIYICAYSLSGKFIGFLLDAMQTDFYPRLSAVAHDHESLNRLVNQQTEIVLLMAMPGLLATLTFAPWLVRIFYSGAFGGATVLLRWFILGCLARVIWAPIGFIQLAKGRGLLYFISEAVINSASLAMMYVLLRNFGLRGAAASYLVSNLFQITVLAMIARRLTGFLWTAHSARFLLTFSAIAVACVSASFFLPGFEATGISGVATVTVSLYCLHELAHRLGPDHKVSRFAARLRFSGRPA